MHRRNRCYLSAPGLHQESILELVLKGDFPLSSISDQSFPGNKLRRGQKVFLVLTHVRRGGVCRGLRAVPCAWVFQGRLQCPAQRCRVPSGGIWLPGIAQQTLCSLLVCPEEQMVHTFKASVMARHFLTEVYVVCLGKCCCGA